MPQSVCLSWDNLGMLGGLFFPKGFVGFFHFRICKYCFVVIFSINETNVGAMGNDTKDTFALLPE